MQTSDRVLRRGHIAAATFFFTNGAVFANLVPRYPELKTAHDMSATVYGVVIAMNPVGAMVAGLAAAALIRRFGSAKVAATTTVLLALGTLAAAWSPSILLLAGSFLVAGAMDAITDVAQNANALRVQERRGRSIINSMHALWSAGAVSGGAVAAGAIALGIPVRWHILGSSVVFACVSIFAMRWALPGPELESGATGEIRVQRAAGGVTAKIVFLLVAMLLIAIGGGLVEEVAFSWAALYLGDEVGAPASLAAAGFIGLVAAQFVGRILSDRFVDRFGARAVVTVAGILIAAGIGLAVGVPTVWGACIGFALAGFGCAPTIPLAMQQADRLPRLRPGTGLTIVTWLMRLAFLVAPPVVGMIADAHSIRAGLTISLCGGLLVLALSVVMPRAVRKGP
ncbi:MAG: MFS transporter [Candidatus Microbacterium stercoravium]|uniref:MFS transporter n=1 Tax=Candidatus Microbacterium stercoravium TaxID=2838697 RepID=A0A9D2KH49_9MICO|nr:MFS transporter [Candidatus Microbacterium stercoravium]